MAENNGRGVPPSRRDFLKAGALVALAPPLYRAATPRAFGLHPSGKTPKFDLNSIASGAAFPNSPLRLSLSEETGAINSLSVPHRVLARAASKSESILLYVGGTASSGSARLGLPDQVKDVQTIGRNWRRTAHYVWDTGGSTVLRIESRDGDWRLGVEYCVPRDTGRLERRFLVRYEGSGEAVLRGVKVTFPRLEVAPDDVIEMPGSPVPPSLALADFGDKVVPVCPSGGPGVMAVRSTHKKAALLCWAMSETEPAGMQVERDGNGLEVSYRVQLADRMTHGMEDSWGSDFLWFQEADWNEALATFQRWWNKIDVITPRDRPRWTESALLYETQIGAAIFDRGEYKFNPYPTIQSLIDKLDYVKEMGFNTVQLMPHHPTPSYAVYDYFNPTKQYGQGFEQLVDECHKRGMRIIVDWVVHGVLDQEIVRKTLDIINTGPKTAAFRNGGLPNYVLNFSDAWLADLPLVNPLRAAHPDWFMKQEDGKIASIYTWAFDLQNAELQDYIIRAMKFYVGKLKVDGFRVDAPQWNSFPNWDPHIQYRPSYSETGAIRLFDKARQELHEINPEIMLYTEEATPAYRRMFDVNYSYLELWLYDNLLSWHRSPKVSPPQSLVRKSADARNTRIWFHNLRAADPAGSKTIHQVDSHDSFWWLPPAVKFRRQQYGPDGYRALFFMTAMLDGGLMQYPTAEQGNEEFVKRVLSLRRSTEEIAMGRCHYLLPNVSSDSVFALGWEGSSGWAFPLVNFGKDTVKVQVKLDDARFGWRLQARYECSDLLNHQPLNGNKKLVSTGADLKVVEIELQPLESALIAVRRL